MSEERKKKKKRGKREKSRSKNKQERQEFCRMHAAGIAKGLRRKVLKANKHAMCISLHPFKLKSRGEGAIDWAGGVWVDGKKIKHFLLSFTSHGQNDRKQENPSSNKQLNAKMGNGHKKKGAWQVTTSTQQTEKGRKKKIRPHLATTLKALVAWSG